MKVGNLAIYRFEMWLVALFHPDRVAIGIAHRVEECHVECIDGVDVTDVEVERSYSGDAVL